MNVIYLSGIDVAVDVEHNGDRQRCGVNVSGVNVFIVNMLYLSHVSCRHRRSRGC